MLSIVKSITCFIIGHFSMQIIMIEVSLIYYKNEFEILRNESTLLITCYSVHFFNIIL